MTTQNTPPDGNRRIVKTADAPEAIRRAAGQTPEVVEYTNPDGKKVWRFIIDGEETMLRPIDIGR